MSDDEIVKQNRDTLLERMNESGNAYSDEYPYGLMGEAEEEIKLLRKERDAALAVVDEFIIDTTTNNETPIHECAFRYDPEKGKCDACEAWGNYVGLFCSSEEEETQ
jgi:hypothetical protein